MNGYLTPWMPAVYMSYVKAALVLTSITPSTGYLRYRLAVQTATTKIEQPNAWTQLEAGWTTPSGSYDERNTGELSVSTSDMWFRLGVAYDQSGGVDTNFTAVLDAICAAR